MNEPGVPLELLLEGLPHSRITGERARLVSSLAIDSRAVTPGALFFALRGQQTDGHRYIGGCDRF